MKRFSVEEVDREFEFGGEIFKWRVPYWEEIADRLDKDIEAAIAAVGQKSDEDPPEGIEKLPDTNKGVIADYIKRIELFLDPENDSVKRWRALVKRKNPAVPMHAFQDLHKWLLEVTTKRDPTEPSSPS